MGSRRVNIRKDQGSSSGSVTRNGNGVNSAHNSSSSSSDWDPETNARFAHERTDSPSIMPVIVEDMEEEVEPKVLIKADNQGVAILTCMLKAINFCEKLYVSISDVGMKFLVEEGKYVQGVLYMKSEIFKTYTIDGDYEFKIPFKELLDCMKILGADGKISGGGGDATDGTVANISAAAASTRSLQITYNGYGTPLCLALDEPGMFTEIELKTEEQDEPMDFDELEKNWEIIMDAKLLQEFLVDLEGYGPEYVTIRVVPNDCVQFRTNGVAGSLKISIPKNCTGLEKFCNVSAPQQATYKFSILRHSFKLVQAADKINLRMMGDNNTLNLGIVFRDTLATCGDFYAVPQSDLDLEDGFDDVDH